MKITREGRNAIGGLWSALGGEPDLGEGATPHDCCDPVPPPDRAADAEAVTVSTPASGGIVQIKVGPTFQNPAGAYTLNFDATPTNGNTMVAFVFGTDGNAAEVTTSGWTKREEGTANLEHVEVWTKVAGAAEPTGVSLGVVAGSNTAHRLVLYEVAGSYDDSDQTTNDSASSPLTGPTLTPASDPSVMLAAFIGQVATYAGDPTWTPLGGFATDSFLRQSPGRLVSWVGHLTTTGGAVTPSLTTTALYAGRLTASAAIVISATPTAAEWNVPAPNTVDSDDATYHEIDGPDVLQIDLGGAFRIVRARLLIGCDDPGTVTYSIKGGNEADLSDAVSLGSVTFDSTGSFTADDVDITWSTTESYRYFELDGPDENRRIFTLELYEPSAASGQDHTHDDLASSIAANSAALDEHVSEILTHLTAETDDTLVLAPDGLGGVEFRAETGGGSYTDPLTTRGDILRRGAATTDRYAIGSAGKALVSDGTDPVWTDQYADINAFVDGGGAAIATGGPKGFLRIDFACTIISWDLEGVVSTTSVMDIKKRASGGGAATSITAAAKPTVTTTTEASSSTLTGWTTAIAAGDKLYFHVDTNNNATKLSLTLKVRRA